MRYLIITACLGCIILLSTTSSAADFPYREKYPDVNILELSDLKSAYDSGDFIIVDVRSKTEFDTIHIKNAIHVPYAEAKFTSQLGKIAEENPDKYIAIYCNGIDCIKSYKAAEDIMSIKVPNVYAFDAGIMAWAVTYPSESLLLGVELEGPEKLLLTEKKRIKRSLDFETFRKKASNKNTVVIDVRDPIQRKHKVTDLEKALPVSLDKFVHNIIGKNRMKDQELLIFDQVGWQVNWLMYYLEDNGYTNFYFLKGGATAVLKKQDYRITYNH